MANERDLSEKLAALADALEDGHDRHEIVKELRKLSNEKYAPGNSQTWAEIKPKSSKTKTYTNKSGRNLPF